MCKLLWMHSALCDECSMYNTGREEGVPYLCPLYLYHSSFEKGGGSKGCFIKQPANFFCQSATFSSKIVDITVINMQLLVWGWRSSWSRNRAAVRCRDGHWICLTDYWDLKHTNTLISSGCDKSHIGLSACVHVCMRVSVWHYNHSQKLFSISIITTRLTELTWEQWLVQRNPNKIIYWRLNCTKNKVSKGESAGYVPGNNNIILLATHRQQ